MYGYAALCLVVYVAWLWIVLRVFKGLANRAKTRALAHASAAGVALLLAPGLAAVHSFVPFPALLSAIFWSLGLPETWLMLTVNLASIVILWVVLSYRVRRNESKRGPESAGNAV